MQVKSGHFTEDVALAALAFNKMARKNSGTKENRKDDAEIATALARLAADALNGGEKSDLSFSLTRAEKSDSDAA